MARRINLIPVSERARTTTNVGMLGLIAGIIIVLFGLGLGYYLLSNSRDDREKELQEVKQETQQVVGKIASLRQYEDLAAAREDREELVQGVYATRTLVADLLDAISLVVPENVWFEEVSLATKDPGPTAPAGSPAAGGGGASTMSIDGQTYSFEDVAQLLVRLQLISTLSEINLDNATSESTVSTVKSFSIEAVVNPPEDTDTPLPLSQVEVEGL